MKRSRTVKQMPNDEWNKYLHIEHKKQNFFGKIFFGNAYNENIHPSEFFSP
jgi:hypothetical protein